MGFDDLGAWIYEQRQRHGWDQSELATRLGGEVGQQAVSRWERGRSRPRRDMIAKLADLFGVDPLELLDAAGYSSLNDRPGPLPLPVRPLATVLPVWELPPDRFEELVADVGQELYPECSVSRFGGQGHKQFGVDVVVEQHSRYRAAYQCKRHKQFGGKMVAAAVAEVEIEAEAFFLVLARRSASPGARRELQKHPGWTLLDGEGVSRIIRGLPLDRALRIVDTYFPGGWRQAFLGVPEPGPWLEAGEFFRPISQIYNQDWQLVGRMDELESITKSLQDETVPIGILTGRGGIGKTRLLREVAIQAEAAGIAVRFLKPGADLEPQHLDLLPHGNGVVVIIDDAQDRENLLHDLGTLLRAPRPIKVIFSLRPYGVDGLRSALSRLGGRLSELPRWDLRDLSKSDATALARQALDEQWSDALADRLGDITADCPFITVVAGVLISRGELDPTCLDHEGTIRKEVLRTFRDVVVADSQAGSPELRRSVLDAISVLQPFRADDLAFQNSLAGLVGQPYDQAIRHVRGLEDAGVLLRRGNSLRIVPDLLGDVVLTESCFDDRSDSPTGYLGRAWGVAEGEAAQHIFVNANRIDWQVRHDHAGVPRLTTELWDTVDQAAHAAGILGRVNLLKLLEKVAYFEPERSLSLVRWLVDNPTTEVETVDHPLARLYDYTYLDVVAAIPAVLRAIAYNLEYLRECLDLLWQLAARDSRETNRYPDHPLRMLQGLAGLEVGKPFEYNETVLEAAEQWVKNATSTDLSPLDVLEPILATEGSEDSVDGFTLRFRPYIIDPSRVAPLRQRALDLAMVELASTDVHRAVRAVSFVESAVRYPAGLFGREVASAERDAWTPVFLETLRTLKDALADLELDPIVAVALRRSLHWHVEFSTYGTTEAAKEVIAALPDSLEMRIAIALFDGWGQLQGRVTDYEKEEAKRLARLEALAEEVTAQYEDKTLLDLISTRLEAQLAAFKSSAGNPGPFVWALIQARPSLGIEICRRLATDPESVLLQVLPVTISALTDLRPDAVLEVIHSVLATDAVSVRRAVAQALGWHRGGRSTILDGELDVLLALAVDTDVFVRRFVVTAAQRLAGTHRADALTLITKIPFADSSEVAEEVFQNFSAQGQLRWTELGKTEVDEMLQQLRDCPSIEDYWITAFLSELSREAPADVVKLLKDRVERWEESDSALTYRPLPHHWSLPLQVRTHPDLLAILRNLRDWIALRPDSWQRQDAGAELFAAVATGTGGQLGQLSQDDGPPLDHGVMSVLTEGLVSGEKAQIDALASILRKAPRQLFWVNVDFVGQALRAGSQLGHKERERMAAAMHGAISSGSFNGTPGQPFARDIEQRDRARAIADSLTRGSDEEQFYRSVQRSAEERIRWHSGHDEKLLDGRDW